MIKQLSKVGNSSALILDRTILDLVGLREGGDVQLTVNSGSLIVTPANPAQVSRERFQECMEKVLHRRRRLLKRLAE